MCGRSIPRSAPPCVAPRVCAQLSSRVCVRADWPSQWSCWAWPRHCITLGLGCGPGRPSLRRLPTPHWTVRHNVSSVVQCRRSPLCTKGSRWSTRRRTGCRLGSRPGPPPPLLDWRSSWSLIAAAHLHCQRAWARLFCGSGLRRCTTLPSCVRRPWRSGPKVPARAFPLSSPAYFMCDVRRCGTARVWG